MSLEAIGELVEKHPSTVSYWLKKHELVANGHARHSPKGEIDQARLCELVNQGASIRKMAEEFDAGYSTVRYWLKQLGLETDRSVRLRQGDEARQADRSRTCMRCPKHGHTTFFRRPEGGFRCGKCRTAAVSKRRRRVKRQLVREAGGQCRLCGFNAHPSALQFHHVDPSSKEFHLSQEGFTRAISRMRSEVKKCILLCANCHALVEAGIRKVSIDER
jgi:hypothetical protein